MFQIRQGRTVVKSHIKTAAEAFRQAVEMTLPDKDLRQLSAAQIQKLQFTIEEME